MNLYPAMQSRMGSWTYYIINMTMSDLAKEVNFASDIHEGHTLGDAIQRVLDTNRVKKEIINYLKHQDRFFSSVVAAALGGNPTFSSVVIAKDLEGAADPQQSILAKSGIDKSFGVLTFDGSQKYYALDGQHRLKAIKEVIDQGQDGIPKEFAEEKISVLLVLCKEDEQICLRKYRRLFSNLNRYAKPTDPDTNIIMDEDDAFAILTRQLINEHELFKSQSKNTELFRVQTKGKSLNKAAPHFTTLQTLYDMNVTLLCSKSRCNDKDFGWASKNKLKSYKQHRPNDEQIEEFYKELANYWDAILEAVPDLHNKEPRLMRIHNESDLAHKKINYKGGEYLDHLLFFPIGQLIMAKLCRAMLDEKGDNLGIDEIKEEFLKLGEIDWSLHSSPWRYLLLVQDEDDKDSDWKMRSLQRPQAIQSATKIAMCMLGIGRFSKEEIKEIYKEWGTLLQPVTVQKEESKRAMWEQVASKYESLRFE